MTYEDLIRFIAFLLLACLIFGPFISRQLRLRKRMVAKLPSDLNLAAQPLQDRELVIDRVKLKVYYPGQFFLVDTKITTLLDGQQIGIGSVNKGINLTVNTTIGKHELEVKMQGRRKRYDLEFSSNGKYEAHLYFNRFWGNFSNIIDLFPMVGNAGESPVRISTMAQYAGFWRRSAASIIDFGILVIPLMGGAFLIMGAMAGPLPARPGPATEVAKQVAGSFIMVSIWLYFAIFESSRNQATLGKLALGLKVTDLNGCPIGFGRATGRVFGKWLSILPLYLGFIMAGFTEKKQAVHDMVAGTLVVKRGYNQPAGILEAIKPPRDSQVVRRSYNQPVEILEAIKSPVRDSHEVICPNCKFEQWEGYTECQKCDAKFSK